MRQVLINIKKTLKKVISISICEAMEIGNVLRNRRQTLRTTQQSLADMSGVSVRMIKAIEGGYANPSIATLEKILNVLGMRLTIVDKQQNDSDKTVSI